MRFFVVLVMCAAWHCCFGQTKSLDNTNYLMAQQYLRQGDYLQAYKNFIIFEYLNFERINMPFNSEAKKKLEAQIAKIEDYLSQSTSILQVKRARGWSDGTADSVIYSKKAQIRETSIHFN